MRKVEPVNYASGSCLCWFCKHQNQQTFWHCAAYPDEIPLEIRYMNVDHRMPHIDDRGVQFELNEDLSPLKYELFLRDFFGDCWDRTEEEIRQEKERYSEMIRKILQEREAKPGAAATAQRT